MKTVLRLAVAPIWARLLAEDLCINDQCLFRFLYNSFCIITLVTLFSHFFCSSRPPTATWLWGREGSGWATTDLEPGGPRAFTVYRGTGGTRQLSGGRAAWTGAGGWSHRGDSRFWGKWPQWSRTALFSQLFWRREPRSGGLAIKEEESQVRDSENHKDKVSTLWLLWKDFPEKLPLDHTSESPHRWEAVFL